MISTRLRRSLFNCRSRFCTLTCLNLFHVLSSLLFRGLDQRVLPSYTADQSIIARIEIKDHRGATWYSLGGLEARNTGVIDHVDCNFKETFNLASISEPRWRSHRRKHTCYFFGKYSILPTDVDQRAESLSRVSSTGCAQCIHAYVARWSIEISAFELFPVSTPCVWSASVTVVYQTCIYSRRRIGAVRENARADLYAYDGK